MDYSEKQEKIQSPAVAIDGNRVRAIREAKKLTQLYVASVVGVTTDTISRWENNRYPSIKRENAEKLALALEVECSDLLKVEEPSIEPEQQGSVTALPQDGAKAATSRRWWWMIGGVVLFAIVVVVVRQGQQLAQLPSAERELPAYAAPGAVIPVKITLRRPHPDRHGLIVKEQLPPGWILEAALPAAMSRGQQQELKWLIPGGAAETRLYYTVRVPVAAQLGENAAFNGTVVRQEAGSATSQPLQGNRQAAIAERHWADRNGDQRIDDAEIMPAYYLTEEFKGIALGWQEIEQIWNSRGYFWDKDAHKARPLP